KAKPLPAVQIRALPRITATVRRKAFRLFIHPPHQYSMVLVTAMEARAAMVVLDTATAARVATAVPVMDTAARVATAVPVMAMVARVATAVPVLRPPAAVLP
ncbi:MAG: hypothetical protein P8Y27_00660, partial [Chromatiaceae bacterium]